MSTSTQAQPNKKPGFGLGEFISGILFISSLFLSNWLLPISSRWNTPQSFALYYNNYISQLTKVQLILINEMFTPYHAIMFAVLLVGGTGVIFKASSGDESLENNPIPVKSTESKFDLKTY